MLLKGCARCGGDLTNHGERDYGHEWVCVQCGHRPVNVSPEIRREKPQGRGTQRHVKVGKPLNSAGGSKPISPYDGRLRANRPRRDRGRRRKANA